MGFDFFPTTAHPAAPIVGDVSNGYTWDGEKWTMGAGTSAPASSANPKPLGPVAPGVATPYSREDHVHPTDFTVRYDVPQALTSETPPYGTTVTQRSQARKNIYAAPLDALAYSGMQINGSMDVSQERGVGNPTTSGHVLDTWRISYGGTMVLAAQQAGITGIPGLSNMLQVTVTTAQPSLGAADKAQVYCYIEGYRTARLAWGTASAQPITIGFWTAHNRPGIYSVTIKPTGSTRSYSTTYTQNAVSTWQYNVITISGDVTGTWNATNLVGMYVMFALASGSSATAPTANVWGANFDGAPGQVNGIAATSDVFAITGVVVLPGIEAPSAARSPLIMRPYDQELVMCKRYWQQLQGVVVDTPAAAQSRVFPGMWAIPTVTGGAAGFVTNQLTPASGQFVQTTRSYQTLVLDARL